MYAVIVSGGKQYRVSQGDVIYVEKLDQAGSRERRVTAAAQPAEATRRRLTV